MIAAMSRTRIVGVGFLIALCLPLITNAATIPELQAQLQILMAQLAALQSQKTTNPFSPPTSNNTPATTDTSCPNLSRNLSRGMKGSDVTSLQQFLISQKLLASDSATGFFGSMTENAIKQFQSKNGIASSGTPNTTGYGAAGPKTRKSIADCSFLDIPLTILTPSGSGWVEIPIPEQSVVPPQSVNIPQAAIFPAQSATSSLGQ